MSVSTVISRGVDGDTSLREVTGHPRSGRRRILFVAPELPSPPTWGFALRVHHLAQALASRHDTRLLAYGPPGSVTTVPGVFHSVTLVAPPAGRRKRVRQLASVASARSDHLGSRRSATFQRALEHIVESWHPDVVQVESAIMSWVRVPEGPVVVLDEHNIESELLARIAGIETAPSRSLFGRLEAWKVRREESLAWERADGIALTSDRDEAGLRGRLRDAWTCVVPNGVDVDAWRPMDEEVVDPDRLVFVGSINYRPNTDAVVHLAREILPLIQRRRPAVRVTVVGQGVPSAVERLRGERIDFAGAVADVRPHVARAAVVVVPLRIGGGTRLKILEALSMGRPVVTSTLGCEGIDAVDRQHLLVADDPATFAARVLELLENPAAGAALGAAGRALTEEKYGWTRAAARLDAFHTTLHARTTGV